MLHLICTHQIMWTRCCMKMRCSTCICFKVQRFEQCVFYFLHIAHDWYVQECKYLSMKLRVHQLTCIDINVLESVCVTVCMPTWFNTWVFQIKKILEHAVCDSSHDAAKQQRLKLTLVRKRWKLTPLRTISFYSGGLIYGSKDTSETERKRPIFFNSKELLSTNSKRSSQTTIHHAQEWCRMYHLWLASLPPSKVCIKNKTAGKRYGIDFLNPVHEWMQGSSWATYEEIMKTVINYLSFQEKNRVLNCILFSSSL